MTEKVFTFGSYKAEIQHFIDEFNDSTKGRFQAESRVLIPEEGFYNLDRRGIIIEHTGEDFKKDFEDCIHELQRFAHKLDKRTSLYEFPFTSEFCDKDKWVTHCGSMVAYNYEL